MADKTDDITAFIELIRALHELRRLRAMVKRLEEWAIRIEKFGPVHAEFAAELRNRMKGE